MNESNRREEGTATLIEPITPEKRKFRAPYLATTPLATSPELSTHVEPASSRDSGVDNLAKHSGNGTPPSVEELTEMWQKQVDAAKAIWSSITEDELLNVEGQQHLFIGIVRRRYDITLAEAEKHVTEFLGQN